MWNFAFGTILQQCHALGPVLSVNWRDLNLTEWDFYFQFSTCPYFWYCWQVFCRKISGGLCEESILSSSGVRSACPECVHCHYIPLLTKEERNLYESWCMFVNVCFSVGTAPALCVLLHRENVIATNHSCQERVKSSGEQWKSHIIFNYLNYRSKTLMIIMLMECHC